MENSKLSAFPVQFDSQDVHKSGHPIDANGLTKREYFAGLAMQGILSDQTFVRPNECAEICARAIDMADELLKQLNP